MHHLYGRGLGSTWIRPSISPILPGQRHFFHSTGRSMPIRDEGPRLTWTFKGRAQGRSSRGEVQGGSFQGGSGELAQERQENGVEAGQLPNLVSWGSGVMCLSLIQHIWADIQRGTGRPRERGPPVRASQDRTKYHFRIPVAARTGGNQSVPPACRTAGPTRKRCPKGTARR
jgi:hypothetical protein